VVRVEHGALTLLLRAADGDADEAVAVPCEPVRNRLRLPSCPSHVLVDGGRVRFDGTGAGHGAGLDVEGAKQRAAAGQNAAALLREAYGAQVVPAGD
jgi:peptidoglycan hydrolase-like amidase